MSSIWQSAGGLLALSIPICYLLRSPLVALAVVLGAVIFSFYVWNNAARDAHDLEAEGEAEMLRAKIRELEERLANVEVINRFEDRLAEKRLREEKLAGGEAGALRAHERE